MYFLDIDILTLQLLPPNWRGAGKTAFLKAVLKPFKSLLNEFLQFRSETTKNINLTAQTLVLENRIKEITNLPYGVFIQDLPATNSFSVNVPIAANSYQDEIISLLQKVVPIGRNYTLNFY